MPKNIIEIKKLVKIYEGVVPTKALKGISITIDEGKITAIVGQSGSGKSTLLNLIGALDNITSGEIIISGRPLSKMNKLELAKFRNEIMGFVFQFHHLLPEFSVIENVLFPEWIKTNGETKSLKRAEELLKYVGIIDIKDKPSTMISGGQKQRVAIARALMNKPKIVLADEPTGNLDSESGGRVLGLFEKINKEQGTTFLLITHDERIAKKADRVIELEDGTIIKDNKYR
jgi:lipoprotein-releasing system ATP-binding protein